MKKHESNLDDFLRAKVDEAEFAYNEAYWEKMNVILDEQDNQKKRFVLWRGLSVILLMVILGGVAYLLPKLRQSKREQVTMRVPVKMANSQSMDSTFQQQKEDQVGESSTTLVSVNKLRRDDPAREQSAPEGQRDDRLGSPDQAADNFNGEQVSTTSNPSTTQDISPTPVLNSQKQDANNIPSDASPDQSDMLDNPSNVRPNTTGTLKKGKTSHADKLENRIDKELAKDQLKPEPSKKLKKNQSKIQLASVSVESGASVTKATAANQNISTILGKAMQPIDTIQYTRRQTLPPTQTNPRYQAALRDYIPVRHDSVTVINYQPLLSDLKSIDAVKPIPSSPLDSPANQFKPGPFQFVLLAGLNMNKGFKTDIANPIKWAFSPYIGFGVERKIRPRLTISTQLGFTYLNALNTELNVRNTQFSFGLDSSRLLIAHKKLLQLYLPFSVYYNLSQNHYVMAALGASYTMDIISKVTETKISNPGYSLNSTKSATTSTSTSGGYRDGFNAFDVYMQIGYAYQLHHRLMLIAGAQQGFTDITKNNFFNNSQNNTQTRFSLGLKFNVRKK